MCACRHVCTSVSVCMCVAEVCIFICDVEDQVQDLIRQTFYD